MTHQSTSIYTTALRKPALAHIETARLFWNYLLIEIAAGGYVPLRRRKLYIVYTVLDWCNAENEMLLNFSYFLIVQGELCWLN